MTDPSLQRRPARAGASWSNRVLLLSLVGIFFLTLYPFRFVHVASSRFLFPFSLNGWGKGNRALDIFLNVLLFVPFGFGLAEKLRERGRSKKAVFLAVYASGAVLSYLVEFLQIYIPARDSGWGDIVTNSAGAAIGALMFEFVGEVIVNWFGDRERRFDSWFTLPKIGVLVSLYAGLWCVLAGPLQKQTRLEDWTKDSFLALGNSASLRAASPWKGRIRELDLWNMSVSAPLAREITERPRDVRPSFEPLVSFRFAGAAPFQDGRHFLSSLNWASPVPTSSDPDNAEFDGRSWLISAGPVPSLIGAVESTGQFALHLVCESADSTGDDARIVSLSSPSGVANLELEQDGTALDFWFRNPFSRYRGRMTWIVSDVFAPQQTRNILVSFDGTALSLFVDGRQYGLPYQLGPAVALAHYVRRIKAVELVGYRYIFYAIIFFPVGCLLGFALRNSGSPWTVRGTFFTVGFLLPSLVLEWILMDAARRAMSLENIALCTLLSLAGSLWINVDRSFSRAFRNQHEPVSVR